MTFAPNVAQKYVDAVTCPIMEATRKMATEGGTAARGAIFTRIEVVNFILDLSGYTVDQPLYEKRLLEPSFGGGDFLLPVISRLLRSWKAAGSDAPPIDTLGNAIKAVELHQDTFLRTYSAVIDLLRQEGFIAETAAQLAKQWMIQGDFLLTPLNSEFDFITGNPPYVRQELIPAPLLSEYRRRYQTMYDRADLYIPFIERALYLLSPSGVLGVICSDRWMKNRYGSPLRHLIAQQFHLKIYVDMTDTPAFHSDVAAYPAVTVIDRKTSGVTRIAYRPVINQEHLSTLANQLRSPAQPKQHSAIQELSDVTNGAEPWLLESAHQMALIRRLEDNYPSLEEAGCKVGIGVATGADKIFIDDFATLDVETDRKLPLVTTKDITSGEVIWKGKGVINPFTSSGDLVNLENYPLLKRYLETNKETLKKRHCAKKSPANWFRTIDRITPTLALKPKLLIPDIKGKAHVVFEDGRHYPHHNLYFVTAEKWDLRALQAVLLSSLTRLFVASYSTKMRGGFLRFQAQYLRRIRIPHWETVAETLRSELVAAAIQRDIPACDLAVSKLYSLSDKEQHLIKGIEI
ncbi:type II DNA modification methyltransferase [Pectobacterium carotovorum subsp. carotovorum]|uniref:Eco57I restriction-modification methylase domain-containing protein n=1 Tax=Pectobacterium carotovorum TaxID=554 RepID=UPI00027E2372|nr:Eco57I restriction-modification methylase domain-containing protein [Pectobacterium carotovorum]AFR04816.1 putative type II DNA modification methylase [Pectobacterium carotovorum subsp. carotovorum PCC21]GKV99953.1 type II DNA modification methyltransferase [Pectobacterium carotovorum subsp. carotovorum]